MYGISIKFYWQRKNKTFFCLAYLLLRIYLANRRTVRGKPNIVSAPNARFVIRVHQVHWFLSEGGIDELCPISYILIPLAWISRPSKPKSYEDDVYANFWCPIHTQSSERLRMVEQHAWRRCSQQTDDLCTAEYLLVEHLEALKKKWDWAALIC